MHIVQRHAAVDDLHAIVGQDIGDGSASALIDLAQLAGLIAYVFLFHDRAQLRDIFRVGVVAAALSAGAGVLVEDDAPAEVRAVVRLHHAGIIRIEGS